MSVKVVKNLLKSQFESVLKRAEKEIKAEGLKKLNELQNDLTSPETIARKLGVDINEETCSEKGFEKFEKIKGKLLLGLGKTKNILKSGIEALENIEEAVDPIVNNEGPAEALREIGKVLEYTLIPILTAAQIIALAQLIANSGPSSSGSVTKSASDKLDKAKGKEKKYTALILTIPFTIMYWMEKEQELIMPIKRGKEGLTKIKTKVDELEVYTKSFELKVLEGCSALQNANNSALNTDSNLFYDPNTSNSSLSAHLALLEQHYNSAYNNIMASGNELYVERMFTLKEDLTENYNISFKTKKTKFN